MLIGPPVIVTPTDHRKRLPVRRAGARLGTGRPSTAGSA